MSDERNGGPSDLDIFEGLGKKSSEKVPVAPPAPPAPPGTARMNGATDHKRTLLGIPGPATSLNGAPPVPPSTRPSTAGLDVPQSAAMRAAQSAFANGNGTPSDAPPGRGSLPNLPTSKSNPPIVGEPTPVAQRTSATHRVATDPPPPYTPAARHNSGLPPPAIVKTRSGKLDPAPAPAVDEDDAAETNVFDRKKVEAQTAAFTPEKTAILAGNEAFAPVPPTEAMSQKAPSTQNAGGSGQAVRPGTDGLDTLVASPVQQAAAELASKSDSEKAIPDPPDTASLSAAFAALGETDASSSAPLSRSLRSAPPASGSMRSAPPPPPPSMQKAGLMTQPMMGVPPPPPPPGHPANAPGMKTLPSMQQPPSVPPPPLTQPYALQQQPPSAPPPPVYSQPQSLPPVAKLDDSFTFPAKEKSNHGFIAAVLVSVVAIAGAAVFLFSPSTGNLVINVADAKGGPVSKLEVKVDGVKKCETAPCVVRDVAAGAHNVSVSAPGFDPVAARAVNVEAGKDATSDFSLASAKTAAAAGTGVKISGPAGAKVQIDGKESGTLPVEIKDLKPGDHKLSFSGDRYATLEKTITVGKDEIVDVGAVPLKVTKGKATIQLGTPGAKVTLVSGSTRKEVPQFPMAIEFDPKEQWELQATKDGMEPYAEKIAFEDGQAEKTYNVTLQPKGAAAKAEPKAPAAHEPGGAAAPAPAAKAKAAPAPKEDGDEAPAPKPSKNTSASNAEATGDTALKINSLPSSSVMLDGKPIGVTPLPHVSVSPGSHTLTFVNAEQSLKKTITVEVKAGETKAAIAKLRE